MVDIPGDASTTQTITVGATVTDQLETNGDHDWYRLELTAGQAVTVTLTAAMPLDAYLRILDSAGNVIRDDLSMSDSTNSRITFTAPETGPYFLDVGAFMNLASGTYQLSVSSYTPLDVWSVDEVAAYLTSGPSFDLSQGNTVTVNITKLDAAGQYLAQQALALWSDITGIDFVQVSTGGQIDFDDDKPGAFVHPTVVNGFIVSALVNVTSQSTVIDGPNIHSHSFQTYVHEIGHALGLKHAGPYDGASIDYLTHAVYANDGWPTTIMSYFNQEMSVYFADQGFSQIMVGTPMIADIMAMQMVYGLSATTRIGDTIYGFNSNAGRDSYNAVLHSDLAYTVFDSGGVDTLDYSGFSAAQSIDLTEGSYSNVGGLVGNVAIAYGTVIENAIGGSGNDLLTGNSADNVLHGNAGADDLSGGGGDDWLAGGAGTDLLFGGSGDDILDGGEGADQMQGGAGHDRYYVNDSGDEVIESAGAGTDRVYSTISLALGANVEQLFLSGNSAINAIGNGGSNFLVGNGAANILNGDAGADDMRGRGGDDTYRVDHSGDLAIEQAGEGLDTVFSSVTYRLREHVENLNLTGSAVRAYGNSGDNRLVGNDGNNILDGLAGADTMRGGLGDDRYYVDEAVDRVIESSGEGNDRVYSSISYSLTSNVEMLVLTGTAFRGNGTTTDNTIIGNASNNRLNGGQGEDVMRGGEGDDVYFVDTAGDRVIENEGEGRDRVYSTVSLTLEDHVDDLFLRGSDAIDGTGNAQDNTILGNVADNVLTGGAGADDLRGGAGADMFVFDDGDFGGIGASICDRIIDFSRAQGDIIDLGLVDANGTLGGDQDFAFIGTGDFTDTAGELRYKQAGGNTYVYGDTDGDGTADFMIRVDGTHSLIERDFVL